MKSVKEFYEKSKKTNNRAEGYTFVETLSVLAISAVLAAGTSFSASKAIAHARRISAKNQISQYYAGLQTYFLDCGRFPTTEQGLSALWEKPIFHPVPENWKGPYIESEISKDPWGGDYKYLSSETSSLPSEVPENLPFVLISYAADGLEGGDGNNEDIVSWK